ncbi:hypothetical protein GCM10025883_30990 [Mobilicoccus caccae]|uniref:Recombination protein RecR n=2 Tax=Mobilicoccus caccae TaxID=1859295 RepID=A0ABQ6IWH9_9MICO|nr:hypothetical protein GCM10025883_30990 [Mobilicoccus caccae]
MYEGAVQDLIDELGRLPGVGPKSAQRIAFHILVADEEDVTRLAQAIDKVKATVRFCITCGNVAEAEQCRICSDPRRDPTAVCVVEEPKDVVAIERTREFRGRYHVLGGAISPIEGIGPDDLRITELLSRLADGSVGEVIIATDPNLEGRPRPPTSAASSRQWGCGSAVSRRDSPSEATSNTPTRSPSVALSKEGECCMPEVRRSVPEELDPDLQTLGEETALEALAFLTVVREVAKGAVPDSAVPVITLALSQILVTGSRLGAINDVVPAQRFEPDLGSDEDVEELRLSLAELFTGIDDYAEVIDPLTTTELSRSQLSGDIAEICAALMHGLRHHADGNMTEALWWWQFSYLATWGARAASALRAMQSILGHTRLDADEETVAEAQFDALHR